jgi:lactate permease
MPEKPWQFAPRAEWETEWMGNVDPEEELARDRPTMGLVRAWVPYLLVALLLVLTRVPFLPLQAWMSGQAIRWPNIFGTPITGSIQYLYLPGFIFLVVIVSTYVIHRMTAAHIAASWKVASGQILGAGIALLFALPLVRVFINSGPNFNASGLESMPITLAEGAASLAGGAWPFFAPWIGALGAFIAGSNTVSNLTFSLFQFATAESIGVYPALVVAAQAVGGAAGNMIAVHNVVAAAATVGLMGQEGAILRKTIFPMLYYCLLAGSLVFVLANGIGLNLGTLGLVAVVVLVVGTIRTFRRWDAKLP